MQAEHTHPDIAAFRCYDCGEQSEEMDVSATHWFDDEPECPKCGKTMMIHEPVRLEILEAGEDAGQYRPWGAYLCADLNEGERGPFCEPPGDAIGWYFVAPEDGTGARCHSCGDEMTLVASLKVVSFGDGEPAHS